MKGYKAMEADMTCLDFQYEIGKSYKTTDNIKLCHTGFHYCKEISNSFWYHTDTKTRLFEVEAGGNIIIGKDKCVCSEIRIIAEVTGKKYTLARYGYGNGNGDGYDHGDGYSYGYGEGNGNGFGDGCDFGDGYYGDGHGNGKNYSNRDNGYGNGGSFNDFGNGHGYRININKILILKEEE